ncbi:MAG TPA: hypothetical protein VIM75_01905 [Ohtaekwangia sp.]|uniref:hypothetical protein n=1 Tax=Ohtaekwangia sp. TaxID=2066019 RepID=UPI002F9207C2
MSTGMSKVMSDMVHEISKALIYISYFSIVVPIYFLVRRKHVLKFRQYRLLGIFFLASVVTDIGSYILAKYQIANIFLINVYFIVSFGILSLMYARLLRNAKPAIYSFFAFSAAVFVIDTFCIHGIERMQNYVTTLCSVLALGYAVVYYDHLLGTTDAQKIKRLPFFWINTAVAYYFGLNLVIFIFSTFVFENLHEDEVLTVWMFHNLNNIMRNLLLAAGLYYAGEKRS